MPSWLDLLMGGQPPVMADPNQQPSAPFNPQTMVQPPVFARAPQMAQDVAAGVAQPLLSAGNYLGGLMQGSQQFSWPETIQHGAALAMAMAPGPKGERIAGGIERGLAGAAESAAPAGIRAYHGSPYDFPAFDMSKIGTGEGAQAYGHGLYFAENEATAKAYRDALAKRPMEGTAAALVRRAGGDWNKALSDFEAAIGSGPVPPELQGTLNDLRQGAPGKMYEVNIKAQPEQFLDWDKPLSEQPENIRSAYQKLTGGSDPAEAAAKVRSLEQQMATLAENRDPVTNRMVNESDWHKLARERDAAWNQWNAAQSGAQFYQNLPRASAAQQLQEAGIPGIRYLDQGSRIDPSEINYQIGAWQKALDNFKAAGETEKADRAQAQLDVLRNKLQNPGTSNYVVFNDKLIDILRKYGLIGMLGGSAAAPIFAPQGQQQQ